MTVIQSVRQHINYLQADTIIFTRDLLQHGTRASVDMCVHRLSLSGFVKRLSVGMYVRHDCSRIFTPTELSDAKKIWLTERRLERLAKNSPGLILSNSQKYQVENFAPPAMRSIQIIAQKLSLNSANQQPPLVQR